MRNIVLTGFMATGKTTAGRKAAERLGRQFIDMDALIEGRAHKTVAQIFNDDGEEMFRRMEADLCRELGTQENLVIATGGGALISADNRAAFQNNSFIVCLTCDLDEVLKRVDVDESSIRPLLSGEDRRMKAFRLLETRRDVYAALPWQIDTTHLSTDGVVDLLEIIGRLETLPVRHPQGAYDIWLGMNALDHTGAILHTAGVPTGTRVAVVSNPVVAPLYAERVIKSLSSCGYHPFLTLMPDGEKEKTLESVERLYAEFLDAGLDRKDTILALGGGVTGDTAGFAAATYMRGVRFVQAPTTLLSMVDSSVGGKTGVDLKAGKNLVGAFKQPAAVIMDPLTLKTLPERELCSGMAEVIKHAVLADGAFATVLEKHGGDFQRWWSEDGVAWMRRTLQVKIDVVEEDPFELNRRVLLNLGHTVGHALEIISDFSINHGEAVSIGMSAEAGLAARMNLTDQYFPAHLRKLLASWGLPVHIDGYDVREIEKAMTHDKKKDGKKIRFALPRRFGEAGIYKDIPEGLLRDAMVEIGASTVT